MNDQPIGEVRAMTAEVLGAMRPLAPLPDALKMHTDRVDRALEVLDARLDQVERAHIELKAALSALKLDEQERRIKSLEDDRTCVKAWAALLALLGSIGAFLAGHFWPK